MSDFFSNNFPNISAASWKQKLQFELDGKDYNNTLLTKTNEGITINPFYHKDTFEKIVIPTSNKEFNVCHTMVVENEVESNKLVLLAIKKGIKSLRFVLKKEVDFEVLFKNLRLKKIEFQIEFHFLSESFVTVLAKHLQQEKVSFFIDPIGNLAKTGNWFKSYNSDFTATENLLKTNSKFHIEIQTGIYQNAGANNIQQVAYALSHANEYLNKHDESALGKLHINFTIGTNFFFEIAKLRAFRYLFTLLLENYNLKPDFSISAKPTFRNKTIYHSKTNISKTATECLAAYLGGADSVSNITYNTIFRKPTEKSEEITIEQLLSLKKEFKTFQQEHIALDTYYIEALTKQIAEKSLDLFQNIEQSGGFLAQLNKGIIQRKIKENAQKEQQVFNNQTHIQSTEHLKDTIEINPFPKKEARKTLIIPITPKRLAEKLEFKQLQNES